MFSNRKYLFLSILLLTGIVQTGFAAMADWQPYPREAWPWAAIDTSYVTFPANFLFGFALHEYQNSGAENLPYCNWATWEKEGHIENGYKSGISCDFWHRYPEDVQNIVKIGGSACKFPIDWSSIEPQKGHINEDALKHYDDVINTMIAAGVQPVLDLYHFVCPQWFEAAGAWSKEENIQHFVKFSELVFKRYGDRVHTWVTIVEPNTLALQGYILGSFPPGHIVDYQGAAEALKNMIKAHLAVYKKIKSLPNGDKAEVGWVHIHLPFQGYYVWDNLVDKAAHFNYLLNTVLLNFYETGKFSFYIPLLANVEFEDHDFLTSMDYMGLEYYSNVLIRNFQPSCCDNEIMTDMQYPIYAEGLYRAVETFTKFNKPIYIMEFGIGDARDDRREIYIKRYLYALYKAMQDFHADVRGVFYWTLTDNFEWEKGPEQKFGLYEVDFKTQKRTLRNGAKCISQFFPHARDGFIEKQQASLSATNTAAAAAA
jgi:beta-glucosidase